MQKGLAICIYCLNKKLYYLFNLFYHCICFSFVSTTTVFSKEWTPEAFQTLPGKASLWIGSAYAVILLIICLTSCILMILQKRSKIFFSEIFNHSEKISY